MLQSRKGDIQQNIDAIILGIGGNLRYKQVIVNHNGTNLGQ